MIIDLGEVTDIRTISADFMQICGPGVFLPSQVNMSASIDGEAFTQLTSIDNNVVRNDEVTFKTFSWEGNTDARFIHFQAQRSDFGGFLFVDEIIVL